MNQPLFGNVEEKSFNSVRYRQQVPLHSVSLQKCCTGLSVKGQSLQRDQTDGIDRIWRDFSNQMADEYTTPNERTP